MFAFRLSRYSFRYCARFLAAALPGVGLSAAAAVVNVSVVNYAFNPAAVTVGLNDQVTWTWAPADGAIPHTTTSDTSGLWDSGIHTQPFSFSKTFTTPGNFPYHCTLHASLGMTGGVTVQGTQGQAPTIVAQPQSQSAVEGQNVMFSVTATGTAPLTYQWRFNGGNIPGTKISALTLNRVKTNNAGKYSVIVSNAFGSVTSDDAVLVVQPIITPNFAGGTYRGLFYESAAVAQSSSGSFVLTLTAKGKFSGRLQIGSAVLPYHGQFDSTSNAVATVNRPGQNPLTITMRLDPNDADRLSGTVSGTSFTANLMADRAVFAASSRPAPQAGQYTLVVAGSADSATSPGGDGVGTLTIDRAGQVVFAGSLADGTKTTQTSVLSKEGYWPLYIPLYRGQGSVLSWISVADTAAQDLGGNLSWFKPPQTKAKVYPGGFTFVTTVQGFHYNRPAAGHNMLTLSSADLSLSGGGLVPGVVNHITLGPGNRVTNQSPNKLSLVFMPGSGTFSGRVVDPSTLKSIGFTGVVLQRMDIGAGYFRGASQSGKVSLAAP